METPQYPIGTQSFGIIRKNNLLYVDKTAYIPRLLSTSRFIFLSRPRRFGKSLLISTLEAYFSNRRELFKGLAIDSLKPGPWEEHVVLHFEFSGRDYNSPDVVLDQLNGSLEIMEKNLEIQPTSNNPAGRFDRIVRTACERSGRGVVILIDEYDNPITSAIGNPDLQEELRRILYGFYSSFKSLDPYIHFCMLTGVTKYGKMSIFSGLNNLKDISFLDDYAGICGITEAELHENFHPEVEAFAKSMDMSVDKAYAELKHFYDGYHFSGSLIDVYNPFSILNALFDKDFGKYWFATGTPTMLIKALEQVDFDVEKLNGVRTSVDRLGNISNMDLNPVPLFYQTGYLTLKSYDRPNRLCTLGFPNYEVESAFMDNILTIYTKAPETDIFVLDLKNDLEAGDVKDFVSRLNGFLSGIPFDLRKNVGKYENYYHSIFYAIAYLIGVDVAAEYHTAQGSIDLVMRTRDYIYIMELKINGTAEDALAQILEKNYASPFASDPRKILLIGLGFSQKTNTIVSEKVEELLI